MRSLIVVVIVLLSLFLSTVGLTGENSSIAPIVSLLLLGEEETSPQNPPNNHNSMLNDLGIVTDLDPRQDMLGNPIPEGFNPLGAEVGTVDRKSEIFLLAANIVSKDVYDRGIDNELIEYNPGRFPRQLMPDDQRDSCNPAYYNCRVTTYGDIDGDGREEIIILRGNTIDHTTWLLTYDDSGQDYIEGHFNVDEFDYPGLEEPPYYERVTKMESGDVDGDSFDELFILQDGLLLILDDKRIDFRAITQIGHDFGLPEVKDFEIEDFDNDGVDEIAITTQGFFYILQLNDDGDLEELIRKETTFTLSNGSEIALRPSKICTGDFDGDGNIEIALSEIEFRYYNSSRYVALIEDYQGITVIDGEQVEAESFEYMDLRFTKWNASSKTNYFFERIDMNGDNIDELIIGNGIYLLDTSTENKFIKSKYGNILNYGEPYPNPTYGNGNNNIAVGNLDGDENGAEEFWVIIMNEDDETDSKITTFSEIDGELNVAEHARLYYGDVSNPMVLAPNSNNDSLVIRYRNEHELLFANPMVIAVLASPPYFAGSNQLLDNMRTTIGWEKQTEEGKTHSVELGLGLTVSVEAEVSLFVTAKASDKKGFEAAVGRQWGTSKETSITIAKSQYAGNDMVIFTATPYDVYYYDIISSPEQNDIGKTISLNMPRKSTLTQRSLGYYNSHNGDNPDIILKHTIGEPFTYYKEADMDELVSAPDKNAIYCNAFATVGGSSGDTEITVIKREKNSFVHTASIEVYREQEIGVSIMLGSTERLKYEHEWTTSISESTYIQGVVGTIPENDDLNKDFEWSVFLYEETLNEMTFPVVTYWVEEVQ